MNRTTTTLTLLSAAAFGLALASFVGCTSLLGDYQIAESSEAGAEAGNTGVSCTTGTECTSGFCTDGVCCESACSGSCESCSIDKGKCVPVPDGQDPDKECLPAPRPDAGEVPEPDASVPVDGGGDGGASEGGVADPDGGGAVNIPDGGFTSTEERCAGSCNGNRACKFPGSEASCGSKFCNSSTEAARFACDGKGHCELGLQACASFSCEGEECRKTCAEENDCQTTHFCNQQGICQERLGNGLGCGTASQCKSGFCVVENGSGVCCNSACSTADFGPGASCKTPGATGQCKCSVACGAGSCRLFYRDLDVDGYGDKDGVTANNTAKVGCDNAPPPAGFVANNTDCDDSDNRAHPGQTGWFSDTTLGKGLNDFNCDGNIQKELSEYPGATCYVCGAPKTCTAGTKCAKAQTSQSRLTCALYRDLICPIGQSCYSCGYSLFNSNTAGFTSTVACGASSATYKTCGKCSGLLGAAPPSSTSTRQQRCH